MTYLILGLGLLVLVLLAGRGFIRANPKVAARLLKRLGGLALVGAAIMLGVTGRLMLAIPAALFGLALLGARMPWQTGSGTLGGPGRQSSVRTPMLEMTLDHDTGDMDGVVLAGRFEGRRLSQLLPAQLAELLEEAQARDAQAAQLLEAYIARFGQGQGAGASGTNGGRRTGAPGPTGPMTVEEAYAVLGLTPGASRDDILAAHRSLMKKYHPDQGGTTYLAAKINEAKDVLIQRVG
jgi:hypothetical protein